MTNREAIEALRDLLDTTREYPLLDGMTMFGEALTLAISALKKQEQIVDASCETCKYKNRSGNTYPCFGCFRASDQDDYYEPYTEDES